jgi:hypothetical protein
MPGMAAAPDLPRRQQSGSPAHLFLGLRPAHLYLGRDPSLCLGRGPRLCSTLSSLPKRWMPSFLMTRLAPRESPKLRPEGWTRNKEIDLPAGRTLIQLRSGQQSQSWSMRYSEAVNDLDALGPLHPPLIPRPPMGLEMTSANGFLAEVTYITKNSAYADDSNEFAD